MLTHKNMEYIFISSIKQKTNVHLEEYSDKKFPWWDRGITSYVNFKMAWSVWNQHLYNNIWKKNIWKPEMSTQLINALK